MPRSEKKKLRTIYVAKCFFENSDENHFLVANDIIDYLKGYEIDADRRTIYRDIKVLVDDFGLDIEITRGGRYRLLSRQFDFEDLRLLAECVHATKFISNNKANYLVKELEKLASIYEAEKLETEVFLCDRVKTTQKGIMHTIGQINTAMAKKRDGKECNPSKISFQYMKYSINNLNTMVERRKGKKYIVSPYKMLINDGNYYLLAFDENTQDMRTYRVDRMKKVEVLEEARNGQEIYDKMDMETYVQRVFSMFGGKNRRIRMKFVNSLLDTVIERLGTKNGVVYSVADKNHFIVSADIEISDQYFSWICGFRKRAQILAPRDVIEEFQVFLQDISSKYH